MMLAMGIGRFAYTPILPLMQQALPFSDTAAGTLASVNYAGYLAGAVVTLFLADDRKRSVRLRLSLLANLLSTAAMGLTTEPLLWAFWRFLSGFSSAGVFVLASGVVLDALVRQRRMAWSGLLYGGVGAGIALTGLTVPLLAQGWGWRGAWLGLAVLALPLLTCAWLALGRNGAGEKVPVRAEAHNGSFAPLAWLTVAYFCEGLGYIVTGTFLVASVQRLPELAGHGAASWTVVGLAAIPSCLLWAWLARRTGFVAALVLAHLVQAAGILWPVLQPGPIGIYGGAVFFGATFLGIVTLAIAWGRTLLPQRGGWVIGLLTAAFGAGQILGPVAAGWLADRLDGFEVPLLLASLIVAAGAVFVLLGGAAARRHHR